MTIDTQSSHSTSASNPVWEEMAIVKIGGNIVDNPEALETFLADFHRLEGRKLLVHGGGVMASKMARQLGIETKMVDGRRITDAETLKLVTMVYAGWINKSIVASLQKLGCQALGLSGADATPSPPKKVARTIDFGFVGDPDAKRHQCGFSFPTDRKQDNARFLRHYTRRQRFSAQHECRYRCLSLASALCQTIVPPYIIASKEESVLKTSTIRAESHR